MRVVVKVEVDIDPESWTLNYGVEGANAIRQDVKNYVQSLAVEQLLDLGLLRETS